MGCGMIIMGGDGSYEAAERKAHDPNMTVNGNPLRKDVDPERCLVHKNMEALYRDADAWNDQRSGMAYRAIRGMTYNGGE